MKNGFKILILLLTTLIFSCEENKNPCNLSKEVLQDIFFIDSMMNNSEEIKREKKWMKENYDEPSLFNSKNEAYRFVWNSSFHGTKSFRIEKKENGYRAIVKEYDDYNDTLLNSFEFDITSENWDGIVNNLNSNGFWSYKSIIRSTGLDGAFWKIEGYKLEKDKCTKKNYHRIHRWSPREDTTFVSMCKQLYNLKPSGELY